MIINLDGSKHDQTNEALEFIKSGEMEKCNKMLILGVNDTDPDNVTLSYFYAGVEPEGLMVMADALKDRIMFLLGYK